MAVTRRMPRWLRVVVATLTLVLGVVVVIRPTTSLDLLAWLIGAGLVLAGLLQLVERPGFDAETDRPSVWRVAGAIVWLVGGVLVLALPGLTVRLVAVVVGVGLLINGVLSVVSGLRRSATLDARIAGISFGIAELVFGVLALAWPDITLLIVAVVFGARLIMGGALELWSVARGEPRAAFRPKTAPGPVRRWTRTVAAVVALALAVGAAVVSGSVHGASPVVDSFYAAPRDVPAQPGRLIRAEPFTRDVPANARGWRILYTTERGDGSAAVASGLVVVPKDGSGPWPVIDWAHGTTGFAQNCAPSLAKHPFESGALFSLDKVVDSGWALVATDYIGLGTAGPHPYLIGPDTAHAVLDAARAAPQLAVAHLGAHNVVWGHSQGGGAALWTGATAKRYAPELEIDGVAALAPASNLPALVDHLPSVTGGSVFASYVAAAYTAIYSDVSFRAYIRPGAQVTVREMSKRCLAEPGVLVSVLHALALTRDPVIFSKDPNTGPLGKRIAQNVPPAGIGAPLLIAQGAADQLVIPSAQSAYVDGLCAAGQQVDYRTYAGLDHVPLVEAGSPAIPDLIAWTHDRFDGVPVAPGCTRRAE
ncbi:lipase family protein [Gryllotalpicola protaetiae]|uniref:lipase family protein n=1 Tax=Gryllotalpicola protaetiae TaxID=2419771 RepID=UPI001FE3512D|nr:lipase family protein [Gryllotalpicola protaetiae]